MEKVLLSIITVSGLCAVSSHAQRQYHFVYELKNMTEAQSYCREKYTDLATIDNMEDVRILNYTADLSKMVEAQHQAWIGLHDDQTNWRWSLSNTSYYKPGETEFRRWAPDALPAHSEQTCTVFFVDGDWTDISCDITFQALCLDVRGPNVTFVLIDIYMTWTEAQSYCREHYTDLASVRNMTENQKIQELLLAGAVVWIGLYKDSWKWSDRSNSSFRFWSLDEPQISTKLVACAVADFGSSGQWKGLRCHHKRAFICYSLPTKKQVIKLSVLKDNPSLDLNDPAVMEDMLKQLKQRLKDQGVNDDIRLSWKKQPDGKVFHKEKRKTKKKTTSTKKDEL